MQRVLIGIIAVALFAGAIAFWLWPPTGSFGLQFQAACWKIGTVMAVWWIAYHEVRLLPAWLLASAPILVAFLLIRPKLLIVAVPVVVVMAILKPRPRGNRSRLL